MYFLLSQKTKIGNATAVIVDLVGFTIGIFIQVQLQLSSSNVSDISRHRCEHSYELSLKQQHLNLDLLVHLLNQ